MILSAKVIVGTKVIFDARSLIGDAEDFCQ